MQVTSFRFRAAFSALLIIIANYVVADLPKDPRTLMPRQCVQNVRNWHNENFLIFIFSNSALFHSN